MLLSAWNHGISLHDCTEELCLASPIASDQDSKVRKLRARQLMDE